MPLWENVPCISADEVFQKPHYINDENKHAEWLRYYIALKSPFSAICDVISKSHAGTVVPECYKDDVESQWKSLKFDPRHPKTPEPMATKIGRGDYVPDIY